MIAKVINMDKLARQALLYDFYGELLTEHQRSIYEEVVLNDFSFSEVAEDQGNQFIIYNLDNHLPRVQTIHYILTYRPFLNRFDKLLYHFKTDICLQKRHFYFFEGGLYVIFCKTAFPPKLFKYILQFVRQALKCHEL